MPVQSLRGASRRLAALTAAATLTLGATSAQALDFNIHYGSGMTSAQISAFDEAAAVWSSLLTDAVTVRLDVGFANLGSGVLGQASTTLTMYSYSAIANAMAADATSAVDASAVASLSATNPTFTTSTSTGGTTTATQSSLLLTLANARALGLGTSNTTDASLTFSTSFGWDYDRTDGTTSSFYDFVTVAAHEIGHVLGFISGVDDALDCLSQANCDPSTDVTYTTLDLFRYSAEDTLDVRPNVSSYLSVDDGVVNVAAFSDGDPYQASHFAGTEAYLMRPFVANGVQVDPGSADLLALDAIGWDVAAAVPEPGTWLLLAGGLAVLRLGARRHRAA